MKRWKEYNRKPEIPDPPPKVLHATGKPVAAPLEKDGVVDAVITAE